MLRLLCSGTHFIAAGPDMLICICSLSLIFVHLSFSPRDPAVKEFMCRLQLPFQIGTWWLNIWMWWYCQTVSGGTLAWTHELIWNKESSSYLPHRSRLKPSAARNTNKPPVLSLWLDPYEIEVTHFNTSHHPHIDKWDISRCSCQLTKKLYICLCMGPTSRFAQDLFFAVPRDHSWLGSGNYQRCPRLNPVPAMLPLQQQTSI